MKRVLIAITALIVSNKLCAQKAELSIIANGGLFHYTGVSSAKQSFLNFGSTGTSYTNDVYGNKNAFSYGGALQLKLISKGRFIAGLQAGYDVLRSRVDIVSTPTFSGPVMASLQPVATSGHNSQTFMQGNSRTVMESYYPFYPESSVYPSDIKGYTILRSSFININPFIGYRIIDKAYTLDVLPGIDIALGLSSREKGKSSSASKNADYNQTVDRGKPETDFRLRLGAEAGFNKWTVSASYASGKSNYMRDYVGGNPQAYSSYLRFGVGYKLF